MLDQPVIRSLLFHSLLFLVIGVVLAACGGGGSPSTPPPAVVGTPGGDEEERLRTAIAAAIFKAETAVDALSIASTDGEVTAARALLEAADDALANATALSTAQTDALGRQIESIRMALVGVEADIPNFTELERLRLTVAAAIDAAETAVDALSIASTDGEVTAAKTLLEAADDALAKATALSTAQTDALRRQIESIRMALVGVEADIANFTELERLRLTVAAAIDAVETAVDALSAASTDEEVTAARALLEAADDALANATALSTVQTDALGRQIESIRMALVGVEADIANFTELERLRLTVAAAIDAAVTAVDALSAASTDEEVAAAKALLDAADDALANATALSTAQTDALGRQIESIRMALVGVEADIANFTELERLRLTVAATIDAAVTAVDALSIASTDEEVAAAKALLDAADDALANATALSTAQADALRLRIESIRLALASVEADIANLTELERLSLIVTAAIDRSENTVDALSSAATDEEVAAAKALLDAADDALVNATALSTAQADALRLRIESIRLALAAVETDIAAHREEERLAYYATWNSTNREYSLSATYLSRAPGRHRRVQQHRRTYLTPNVSSGGHVLRFEFPSTTYSGNYHVEDEVPNRRFLVQEVLPSTSGIDHGIAVAYTTSTGSGGNLLYSAYGWWAVSPVIHVTPRLVAAFSGLHIGVKTRPVDIPGSADSPLTATWSGRATGHAVGESSRWSLRGDVELTATLQGTAGTVEGKITNTRMTAVSQESLQLDSSKSGNWHTVVLKSTMVRFDGSYEGVAAVKDPIVNDPQTGLPMIPEGFAGPRLTSPAGKYEGAFYGPGAIEAAGSGYLFEAGENDAVVFGFGAKK